MRTPRIVSNGSSLDRPRGLLHAGSRSLFAVLDACDEPRVLAKVQQSSERGVSLYCGWAEERWAEIAPYLVQVDEALSSRRPNNPPAATFGRRVLSPPT